MKLKDYNFGYTDAIQEYIKIPGFFESVFYDKRNLIEKLLNGTIFLLIGRKGVGKSAYSAKIQSIGEKDTFLKVSAKNFSNFEFSIFAKNGINSNVTGPIKYKSAWDFLLLKSIYQILYKELGITETEGVNKVVSILSTYGFDIDECNLNMDAIKLKKIKGGLSIKFANAEFEFDRVDPINPKNYPELLGMLISIMQKNLEEVYLNQHKIVIIIDGLDDIIRYKNKQTTIISSLIRSIKELNLKMTEMNKDIRFIILIRDSIVALMNDPDLNKIIQDCSFRLNWNNRLNDLKELINLRFKFTETGLRNNESNWDTIFPYRIEGKSSWEYALQYTLYKPRDILSMLKICQEKCYNKETVPKVKFKEILRIYANDYFIGELKDELSGFIADEVVSQVPNILFSLVSLDEFGIQDVERIISDICVREDLLDNSKIKLLLLHLFDAGYIGQKFENTIIFKYMHPHIVINYNYKFVIHRGIRRAFTGL